MSLSIGSLAGATAHVKALLFKVTMSYSCIVATASLLAQMLLLKTAVFLGQRHLPLIWMSFHTSKWIWKRQATEQPMDRNPGNGSRSGCIPASMLIPVVSRSRGKLTLWRTSTAFAQTSLAAAIIAMRRPGVCSRTLFACMLQWNMTRLPSVLTYGVVPSGPTHAHDPERRLTSNSKP